MAYNDNKDLFTLRIEELNNIKNFDMEKFKEENPTLSEIINLLMSGIARRDVKKFSALTIVEKEEVLKNLFIEKEEELETEEEKYEFED